MQAIPKGRQWFEIENSYTGYSGHPDIITSIELHPGDGDYNISSASALVQLLSDLTTVNAKSHKKICKR